MDGVRRILMICSVIWLRERSATKANKRRRRSMSDLSATSRRINMHTLPGNVKLISVKEAMISKNIQTLSLGTRVKTTTSIKINIKKVIIAIST